MDTVFRFDRFTLDTKSFELRCGSVVIPVEPLVLDLIKLLLERPGVLLSRDTLSETVWNGRIVADSTISTALKSARKALGDTGRDQKFIRTVRGRGIQFMVPVEHADAAGPEGGPQLPGASMQPEIYVRPFDTLGDPSLDLLARALRVRTRSILTRIPLLRIASSFPQADRMTDARSLRSRFGITHVLDVRLQRVDGLLMADAALTETEDGLQIWARQFETGSGAGEQEALLSKMISRIEPRLMQAMVTEMKAAPGPLGSRANLLQAIVLLSQKGWRRTTFVEAIETIDGAIKEEPDFALSHAYLALLKALGHRVGILRDNDTTVPTAILAAERALELDGQDSAILGLAGCALADLGQVDRALPILNKAIALDPQNGHAKTALGAALMMKRDYGAAVRYLTEGIDCSPADNRRSVWGAALALAHLAQGETDDALEAAENACREDDLMYLPRLALTAVHLVRNDRAGVGAAARDCLRTKPDLNRHEVTCAVGPVLGAGVWAAIQPLTERSA